MKAPHPAISCGLCLQPTDEDKWRQGPRHVLAEQKRRVLGAKQQNSHGKPLQLRSAFPSVLWDLSENSVFYEQFLVNLV